MDEMGVEPVMPAAARRPSTGLRSLLTLGRRQELSMGIT